MLDKFELADRLIKDISTLNKILKRPIDFDAVQKKLAKERQYAEKFLVQALFSLDDKKNVSEVKKDMCSGCGKCMGICPRHCIQMVEDDEGFIYPVIELAQCTSCGSCLKYCPIQQRGKNVKQTKLTYLGYNAKEEVRNRSSSGGVFSAIANEFLKENASVYGAAFDDDFKVIHKRVVYKHELNSIMRSKYIQSSVGHIYLQAINDLKNGKKVLFSGTPCQIAAIKTLAEKSKCDSNLYCLDFICHGVPSSGVWRSYLEKVKQGKEISEISFRDKSCAGWHDFYFRIHYKDGSWLSESHEINAYMGTFLSDKNLRPACYQCKFKDESYYADITLGDAWKVEKDCPEWADDKGTSLFIVRTEKGQELLKEMMPSVYVKETDYEKWKKLNPSLITSTDRPVTREEFFADYNRLNSNDFWKAQKNIPMKKIIRYMAKKVLRIIGLEKVARSKF